MLGWFKTRAGTRAAAKQLYAAAVTQARQETFYADLSVPDQLAGRFEMIVLHLFMLVERLQHEGEAGQEMARSLLEAFVIDIDDHMREVGIADLKVPKHVKKAAAIAYDRFEDYGKALKNRDNKSISRCLLGYVYGLDKTGDVNAGGANTATGSAGANAANESHKANDVGSKTAQDKNDHPAPLSLSPSAAQTEGAAAIASYTRRARQALAGQNGAALLTGDVSFPKAIAG